MDYRPSTYLPEIFLAALSQYRMLAVSTAGHWTTNPFAGYNKCPAEEEGNLEETKDGDRCTGITTSSSSSKRLWSGGQGKCRPRLTLPLRLNLSVCIPLLKVDLLMVEKKQWSAFDLGRR